MPQVQLSCIELHNEIKNLKKFLVGFSQTLTSVNAHCTPEDLESILLQESQINDAIDEVYYRIPDLIYSLSLRRKVFEETGEIVDVYSEGRSWSMNPNSVWMVDEEGRILSNQYLSATPLKGGVSIVKALTNDGPRLGAVGKDGKEFISPKYASLKYFPEEEVFIAQNEHGTVDSEFFLLRKDGEEIPDSEFDHIDDFYDGYALANVDGRYYFINARGKSLLDQGVFYASSFSDGLATVFFSDKGYRYIDIHGEDPFDKIFTNLESFSEGYAWVKHDNEYYILDKEGNERLVKGVFQPLPFSCGFSLAKTKVGCSVFVDFRGRILNVKSELSKASDFEDGVAIVKVRNGNYFFLSQSGELFPKNGFSKAPEKFSCGWSLFETDEGYNYMNKKGELLVPSVWFASAESFRSGIVHCMIKETLPAGNIKLKPCVFDVYGEKIF